MKIKVFLFQLVCINSKVDLFLDQSRCYQPYPFKKGPNSASFCLFLFFSHDKYSTNLTTDYKSMNGALGTRTQSRSLVGTYKSIALQRHPISFPFGPKVCCGNVLIQVRWCRSRRSDRSNFSLKTFLFMEQSGIERGTRENRRKRFKRPVCPDLAKDSSLW